MSPETTTLLNPNEAIRAQLFDNAAQAHRRTLDRIDACAEELGRSNALGVIGALEDAEEDIRLIRTLMILVRDHFSATTKQQGGNHAR
jgi:hypothetical protein